MTRPHMNPWTITPILSALFIFLSTVSVYMIYSNCMFIIEFPLLNPSPSLLAITLIVDPMSTIFMSVVTLISSCVYNFSKGYMLSEPYLTRFSALVLSFIMSMYLLISIPNMLTLLLGWDGLGLTSFLLIIYYQNPKSLGAGMFTFMSNRLGDALIIISITLTLSLGQWNIIYLWHDPNMMLMSVVLLTGAVTKSAQIPFSSWLPAAMAAPTPVSALVHSSTLVTAGVYLLIRFYPMFSTSLFAMKMLMILSTLTTLMAGTAALFETDMKKIIALSTLSQLGIMMMSLSLSSPQMAFFHLITHATFKALLFISAGTLIHTFANTQDLRLLGNVSYTMPLTAASMNTANIALCGLPFLSGFYSKDQIIELSMSETSSLWMSLLTGLSTGLTAAYSMRLSYYTLWSPSSSTPLLSKSDNFANDYTSPMILMALASMMTGTLLNWLYVMPIYMNPLPMSLKLFALLVTLTGLILSYPPLLKFMMNPIIKSVNVPNLFMTMWFLTPLTTQAVTRPVTKVNAHVITSLDHGWNELLGPQGTFNTLKVSSQTTTYISNIPISSMLLMFILVMILSNLFTYL